MAPEQARGDSRAIDRRTDVYSLGVTAYEILTGTLPFSGTNAMDVLVKIINDDPPPLRAHVKSLPADLETIVMKCLEKDPARRYDSARALAEDCRRFLDGEPISARPVSRVSRAVRVVRKNRWLFATIVAALLLVVVAGAFAIRERLNAQRRAEVAQRLAREVSQVESIMRIATMLPPHDMTRERQLVRRRIEAIRGELAQNRALAAPAHYAIGRGLLTLGEPREARTHLETAWRDNDRAPETAYALGLSLGAIYEDELAQARVLRGEALKSRLEQIDNELRKPAVEYLQRAKGAAIETPAYGEALVAYLQQNHALALKKADEALAAVPWLHEAHRLKGEARLALGSAARDAGNFDAARQEYDRADTDYRRAITVARSDVASYEGLAKVALNVMWMQLYGPGGDMQPPFARVRENAAIAMTIDPRRPLPHVQLARGWRLIGDQLAEAGNSPLEAYANCRAAADRASRLDPAVVAPHKEAAISWQAEANWLSTHGGDPRQALASAISSLERAMRTNPADFIASNSLGNAHLSQGQWLESIGQDPMPALKKAVTQFQTTIRIAPRYAPAFSNMGLVYTRMAEYQQNRGASPVEALDASIKAYKTAVAINPKFVMAFNNMGLTQHQYGKLEEYRGGDPRPHWNAALETFNRSSELNPDYALPPFNRTLIWSDIAEYEQISGRDPSAAVARAEEEFAKGLKLNATIAAAYLFAVNAHMARADYLLERGQSPDATLDRVFELLHKSLEIDPKQAASYELIANAHVARAAGLIARKRSPEAEFAAAAKAEEKALQLRPDGGSTLKSSAELYTRWAEWKLDRGQSAASEVRRAREYADAALRINQRDAEVRLVRGRVLLMAARAASGADQQTAAIEAVKELQQAVSMNAALRRTAQPLLAKAEQLAAVRAAALPH
jgi:eukaryotic-like serine/threonine-protein kinase